MINITIKQVEHNGRTHQKNSSDTITARNATCYSAATISRPDCSAVVDVRTVGMLEHEPQKKSGAGMFVMVIHAVIFALFGIGSLIFCVFSVVQLTTALDNSTSLVTILSSLIIAVLYGLAFLRTLNPFKKQIVARLYGFVMLGVVALFVVLSFIGPIAQSMSTKDDRRIDGQLESIKSSIESYISINKKLPVALSDVSLSAEAKKIVADNLVTYKADGESKIQDIEDMLSYKYRLCATYKQASQYKSNYATYADRNEYSNYLSTSNHDKGEVCYKLAYDLSTY